MGRFVPLVILLTVVGCCTQPQGAATQPSQGTRLASLYASVATSVGANGTSNHYFVISQQGLNLQTWELSLFAKEVGTERRVVLEGTDLSSLVQARDEWKAAGFKNVVLGIAVGE